MKHTLLYIYITVLAALFGCVEASAQGEAMDANIHVSFAQKGSKEIEYKVVQYALFKTENKANQVREKLDDAIKRQRGTGGKMVEMDAWDNAVAQQKVKFRSSKGNGDIKVHAYPDMAVLICTYLPEDELTIEDAKFEVVTLKEGQGEYNVVFTKAMGDDQTIKNVDVYGTNRDTLTMDPAPVIDDGKNLFFKIHVELPAGYGSNEGRLIVQPMAVECQTEDTVDYISGLVMEGDKYHMVQNRMMKFDYMKYDKVAYAYMPQSMSSDEKILIDTTLVYVKPKPQLIYKVPYQVQIADMNHVYFHREAATGSCNAKKIFKFLDLGVGAADMDLAEFRIDAESNYSTKNQDLRLKFEVGKSVLTTDSTNQVQLKNLVEELRSYGDQLMEVKIEATASPEGGYESNRKLATERTSLAASKVKQYLGKVDIAYHVAQPRVCTWEDVAKQVEENGDKDLANRIRQNMGQGGYGGDATIMNFPEFAAEIQPVLENLRIMRVTYRYEREHVMDQDEVREAYYQRKAQLLKGTGKDFSDGDYYNLYNVIKDSLEQDTLTMIAYKHIISHPGYEQEKFSMYVANRMAMLNQRRGKPDISVLKPFINQHLRAVSTKDASGKAQKNRREILINQIITYFQLEERDTALSYVRYWFADDNDPKVERLKQYITFKEDFLKYATGQLDQVEKKNFENAMNFVFSCAKDNKAVIYAEAYDLIGKTHSMAETEVKDMDDDNAKKWYLMGILAAKKEEEHLTSPRPQGFIPDYLAYFHHSFQMEPSYKLLYFEEGQVSDQLREKFRYRKKDYPKYVSQFNKLVILRKKVNYDTQNDDEMLISGDDDEETAISPAADNKTSNGKEAQNGK